MALFKPAWMGTNQDKALSAAAKETDETKLCEIALKAPLREVQLAAIERIRDSNLLLKIAANIGVKGLDSTAIGQISDFSVLMAIVGRSNQLPRHWIDFYIRLHSRTKPISFVSVRRTG